MKKLEHDRGEPVTDVSEWMGATLAPAAGIFVPLILLISFLHSLLLLVSVLAFFLSLPFLVYGFSERHRLVFVISVAVFLASVFGCFRALGIA